MRRSQFILAFALGLSGTCPATAGSDGGLFSDRVEYLSLPPPAGLGRLVLPAMAAAPLRLVVMVPDALGEDGRSEPYVEALTSRGIATLVLGVLDDAGTPLPPADPAGTPEGAAAALRWAMSDERFQPDLVGFLGFGAGGRAVLAAMQGRPTVALYPGCVGLTVPEAGPALILHGLAAPGAEACMSLPRRSMVEITGLPGLGHGWDTPIGMPAHAGVLLPGADGTARIRAQPDPQATEAVADLVAMHLAAALVERQQLVEMAP
jgi:dienelactone hydrolase